MKRIFTLMIAILLTAGFAVAQEFEGPAGTFVGPTYQVVCGNTQNANAIYYIVLTADDYSAAREMAGTTMERLLQFYQEYPSFLSEFYNCRPVGCKPPAGCDSTAEIQEIDPIVLTPLGGNLFLLQMDIKYKVACDSCKS